MRLPSRKRRLDRRADGGPQCRGSLPQVTATSRQSQLETRATTVPGSASP